MYPNPKRAKLYAEVVPKTVDEYLTSIEKYPIQKKKDQISTQSGTFIMESPHRKEYNAVFNAFELSWV